MYGAQSGSSWLNPESFLRTIDNDISDCSPIVSRSCPFLNVVHTHLVREVNATQTQPTGLDRGANGADGVSAGWRTRHIVVLT